MMILQQQIIVIHHFYWYKVLSVSFWFHHLSFLGLLASVGDLTVEYYINESSVLLSWTAPYTLDNVSITGYSINDNSSRILNTTELSFILSSPDPINPEVCDMTNVTVSAVNGAGIGQPANTGFYYKRGILICLYFNQSTLQ